MSDKSNKDTLEEIIPLIQHYISAADKWIEAENVFKPFIHCEDNASDELKKIQVKILSFADEVRVDEDMRKRIEEVVRAMHQDLDKKINLGDLIQFTPPEGIISNAIRGRSRHIDAMGKIRRSKVGQPSFMVSEMARREFERQEDPNLRRHNLALAGKTLLPRIIVVLIIIGIFIYYT